MTNQLANDLRAARALIERPEAWTQHTSARNARGIPVRAANPSAVAWCSIGALTKCTNGFDERYELAAEALYSIVGVNWLAFFNDCHTHEQVLRAFDAAIAKAEGR